MGCPICGRIYCDHTPDERGQTFEEMMNDCYRSAESGFKEGESTVILMSQKANSLIDKLEKHHKPTYEHSLRASGYVLQLARQNDYDPLHLCDVKEMAVLHDIGKLSIKPEVLDKELSASCIKAYQQHGYELLKKDLPYAACAAGKHNSKYAVKAWPAETAEVRPQLKKWIKIVELADFCDELLEGRVKKYAKLDIQNKTAVYDVLKKQFLDLTSYIGQLKLE